MTGNINDAAYNGIQAKDVYASMDNNPQDEKVDYNEAKTSNESIFTQATNDCSAELRSAIQNSKIADKANAEGIVEKYLGGKTFASMINFATSFGSVSYSKVHIEDSENEADVQQQIDTQVGEAIKGRIDKITSQISSTYEQAIKNAITQAENELVGDADISQYSIGQDGNLVDQEGEPVKIKLTSASMSKISYDESAGKDARVATYSSNGIDVDEADQSEGYKKTAAYLKASGAKIEKKLVNGVEQNVYKIKVDGETQYVVVDDAGQVHGLDKDKMFLRKSRFTTTDSVEDARNQSIADGVAGNDVPPDAKVIVRKVDGQNQSVLTWKDDNGEKHFRVIDHNDQTGMTSSADVHQTNAALGYKFASDTSGLGAWASRNADDAVEFSGGRFHNGGVVRTEGSRMKYDASHIGSAITNISNAVTEAGGTAETAGNVTTIKLNGHEYKLDSKNHVAADRTMRLIQGELDRMSHGGSITIEVEDTTVDTSGIVEDGRVNTNEAAPHSNERWAVGSGGVQDVGVDAPTTHQSSAGGRGKVNSVRYGANLSRAQFANEGWRASAGRQEEASVITAMDSATVKGQGKSVRNLKNATEFAERFIKAKGLDPKNYNLDTLAKALTDANPSLFAADGSMYRNCDFSRINLPKKLDRYAS